MIITGTEKEIDWAMRSLFVAGLCDGCLARVLCEESENIADAQEIPIEERETCEDMLKKAIGKKIKPRRT